PVSHSPSAMSANSIAAIGREQPAVYLRDRTFSHSAALRCFARQVWRGGCSQQSNRRGSTSTTAHSRARSVQQVPARLHRVCKERTLLGSPHVSVNLIHRDRVSGRLILRT